MSVLKALKEHGVKNTFKFGMDLIQYKINKFFIERYGNSLVKNFSMEINNIHSLDEAFDLATTWKFKKFSIKPLQNKSEFINFANYVLTTIGKPKKIIEVGTANGGTLFLFAQLADVNSTILSIDRNHYLKNELDLFKTFGSKAKINIHNICLNTHNVNSQTISKYVLEIDNVDLLFIDADHSYDGVKHDFFQDINPDRGNGVPKFFDELKKEYNFEEFRVKNYGWGGIGVIIKK